jgi:hypothetical protein
MSIWQIQYQDAQGAIQVCLGEQDCRPSEHEAIEIVIQSLIQAARTSMSAALYLTLLSADALSELRIRSISPANAITLISRSAV